MKNLGIIESFKKLPPTIKWGIIIAILVIVFFIIRKIVKIIQISKQMGDIKLESNEWEKRGEKYSYTPSQYKDMADSLENAMFDIGTKETQLFDVFKQLNNNLDFLALKKAFGVRNYTGGVVPGFLYGDYTLQQWINEELNKNDIQKLNNILSEKEIVYFF